MDRICRQAEAALSYRNLSEQVRAVCASNRLMLPPRDRLRLAWAASAVDASFEHESTLIVALAKTGAVGRLISQFRPQAPIVLGVPTQDLARQLLLCQGIFPVHLPQLRERTAEDCDSTTTSLEAAAILQLIEVGKRRGICKPGDTVVGVHKEYLQGGKWNSVLKSITVN